MEEPLSERLDLEGNLEEAIDKAYCSNNKRENIVDGAIGIATMSALGYTVYQQIYPHLPSIDKFSQFCSDISEFLNPLI